MTMTKQVYRQIPEVLHSARVQLVSRPGEASGFLFSEKGGIMFKKALARPF
ncbi:hypothetical protein D3OALGA1CA_5706 [Olavius algarvensis associated proteobacterium Delta 3]|nr:hypothetical protein D3OALGA1CA_5706 [Olavius algarvensis associated proteobacterium Delta 3]